MPRPEIKDRAHETEGPTRVGTLVVLAALVLAGCDLFGPDGGAELNLSGTVRDRVTDLGIGGAQIGVSGRAPFTSPGVLTTTTTDDSGRFTLRVTPPANYSEANCAVMDVDVRADGYAPLSGSLSWYLPEGCSSGGRYTANFELSPVSAAPVESASRSVRGGPYHAGW